MAQRGQEKDGQVIERWRDSGGVPSHQLFRVYFP